MTLAYLTIPLMLIAVGTAAIPFVLALKLQVEAEERCLSRARRFP